MFAYLRAIVVPTAVYAATEDWGGEDTLAPRITRAGDELAALMTGTAATAKPAAEFTPFEQQLAALRSLPAKGA